MAADEGEKGFEDPLELLQFGFGVAIKFCQTEFPNIDMTPEMWADLFSKAAISLLEQGHFLVNPFQVSQN